MISYACPVCHGALYIDTFRADQHMYAEFICINGGHLWAVEDAALIVRAHEACCTPATRNVYARKLKLYASKEAPWLNPLLAEVAPAEAAPA